MVMYIMNILYPYMNILYPYMDILQPYMNILYLSFNILHENEQISAVKKVLWLVTGTCCVGPKSYD